MVSVIRARWPVVGCAAIGLAAALFAPPAGAATATVADVVVDRTLRDDGIAEASGMAASRRAPGTVWVHEDSGNPARLFAIDSRGRTTATVAIAGVEPRDWEAMAAVSDPANRLLLAVADIGDNRSTRAEVSITVIAEPSPARDLIVQPRHTMRLRYPDGARNAEALLADPRDDRLYVVTKELIGATIYAVPPSAWPGDPRPRKRIRARLEPVARVPVAPVTDGAMLADGRIVLRTYAQVAVFPALDPAAGGEREPPTLEPLVSVPVPEQELGESMAVVDDGKAVLLGSEGVRQPILRIDLPETPRATPSPSESAGSPRGSTTGDAADDGLGRFLPPRLGALGVLAGALLSGALVVVLRSWRGRRRR